MYKKEFVSGLGSWLRSCGRSKWFLAFAVLLVFISSLVVSSRGIDWAKVHPDEGLIAQWMNEIDDAPYIQSRVYPEGLFTFARVFRQVKKDATKISSHAENWTQQPALKYAIWKPDSGGMNEWIGIGIIRRWNVAFVALSAVCVLLTACAILDSIPLSILAALFYAFHPFVVEHAHYAETDPLMLFSATLTFWLLTAAMKKKGSSTEFGKIAAGSPFR